MSKLEKIIGSERSEKLSNYNYLNFVKSVNLKHSIIIGKNSTEFDESPILIEHIQTPTLQITAKDGDFSDYFWLPIKLQNATFTGLIEKKELGDVVLITDENVFELDDAKIDLNEKILTFKCATLRNEKPEPARKSMSSFSKKVEELDSEKIIEKAKEDKTYADYLIEDRIEEIKEFITSEIKGCQPMPINGDNIINWVSKDGSFIFSQCFGTGYLVINTHIWNTLCDYYNLNNSQIEEIISDVMYKYTNNGQLKVTDL